MSKNAFSRKWWMDGKMERRVVEVDSGMEKCRQMDDAFMFHGGRMDL